MSVDALQITPISVQGAEISVHPPIPFAPIQVERLGTENVFQAENGVQFFTDDHIYHVFLNLNSYTIGAYHPAIDAGLVSAVASVTSFTDTNYHVEINNWGEKVQADIAVRPGEDPVATIDGRQVVRIHDGQVEVTVGQDWVPTEKLVPVTLRRGMDNRFRRYGMMERDAKLHAFAVLKMLPHLLSVAERQK